MLENPYVGQQFILSEAFLKLYGMQYKDLVYTIKEVREWNADDGVVILSTLEIDGQVVLLHPGQLEQAHSMLVDLVKTDDGNLKIVLLNRQNVQEIADYGDVGWNAKERDILEYWLCNGWDEVPHEMMGLTNASFYSDSVQYDPDNEKEDVIIHFDRVYTDFQYYQVRSWVEDLLRDGYAILHGYSWEDVNA